MVTIRITRSASRRDGKFQYLDCRMFSDGGPYECESYGTLMTGALMSGGPYIIPNVKVEGSAIRNNNLQGGAFPRLRHQSGCDLH